MSEVPEATTAAAEPATSASSTAAELALTSTCDAALAAAEAAPGGVGARMLMGEGVYVPVGIEAVAGNWIEVVKSCTTTGTIGPSP